MSTIVLLVPRISERILYTANWILGERLKTDYRVTDAADVIETGEKVIAYGRPYPGAVLVPASGLLDETGIHTLQPELGGWDTLPVIFYFGPSVGSVPFDLFSAIFYLLSRYEEYNDFVPDKYGRFQAGASILAEMQCLQRPIADEWVNRFRLLLNEVLGLNIVLPDFRFVPTYDIDIAWSYKHKGIKRNLLGGARSLIKFRPAELLERVSVLAGVRPDPYDCFGWLGRLHGQLGLRPLFFVLAAGEVTDHDKNISPGHMAMQGLIRFLDAHGRIAMHPSYYSTDAGTFGMERNMLAHLCGRPIVQSRQHYIRLQMPQSLQVLVRQGFSDDYSMGYGTHLGFRAGTGAPFFWYDLEKEAVQPIRVHPFCFMDTTALYEQGSDALKAFSDLDQMTAILKETGSCLTTVFHNFSLGTDPVWTGWRGLYEAFMWEHADYART